MTEPAPQPTELDIANAERRKQIADRFRQQFLDALALAEQVLGAGWEPTGFHTLIEKDEEDRARRTNDKPKPSATVITAAKDGKKRHFRVETMTECETPEAGFGDMLLESHPTKGFEHRGQWCRIHRYSLCWGWYEADYRPASAEKLAEMRQRREEKAEAKAEAEAQAAFADELKQNLFADLVKEEGPLPPKKKGSGRG